jgi:hypothetical protein
VVWLTPPLLAGFLLLTWRGSLARRLVAAVVLVLSFSATIAPWTVRNTRLERTLVTIDTMGGRNFMMGNYRHTPMYRSWDAIALQGEKAWDHEVVTTSTPEQRDTQGKIDKLALRRGLQFVRESPALTLKRDAIKFFDFWGLERELVAGASLGYFGALPRFVVVALAVVIIGAYIAAMLFGILGAVLAPPDDRRLHWYFLLVIAFICGMHTLVFGHSRYHLPLIPLVLLYAGAAAANAGMIWQQRGAWRFWAALALFLVLVGGWSWCAAVRDWEQIRGVLPFLA